MRAIHGPHCFQSVSGLTDMLISGDAHGATAVHTAAMNGQVEADFRGGDRVFLGRMQPGGEIYNNLVVRGQISGGAWVFSNFKLCAGNQTGHMTPKKLKLHELAAEFPIFQEFKILRGCGVL